MIDVSTHPILILSDAARLLRSDAERRARGHGLTRAQWIILTRLERDPGLSQRELADLLEVEPIIVGRLVDRLEGRGLVERRADPNDRRMWRLHLRAAATPILENLHAELDDLTATALDGITDAERAALVTAMLRVKANLLAGRRDAGAALRAVG